MTLRGRLALASCMSENRMASRFETVEVTVRVTHLAAVAAVAAE